MPPKASPIGVGQERSGKNNKVADKVKFEIVDDSIGREKHAYESESAAA